MYQFIDTTERPELEQALPSEAVCINGVWLEKAIPGYKTLSVSGREAVMVEKTEYSSDDRDGSVITSQKIASRTITVQYQMLNADPYAFRAAYNELNRILIDQSLRIAFNDEPDKYFIGALDEASAPEAGTNNVTGEFSIYCADPFKYSLEEKRVSLTSQEPSEIAYRGTYPARPRTEIQLGDRRYRWVSVGVGDETIVSVGNDETYVYSDVVLFKGGAEALVNGWVQNESPDNFLYNEFVLDGDMTSTKYYAAPASFGTNADTWHGPSMTLHLSEGAKNINVTFGRRFQAEKINQLIYFYISLTGTVKGEQKVIAEMKIAKTSRYNFSGAVSFRANGLKGENIAIETFAEGSKQVGVDAPRIAIKKVGAKVTFRIGNDVRTMVDADLEDAEVEAVSYAFAQYDAEEPVSIMRLIDMEIVKSYEVETSPIYGEELDIDCATATISIDGNNRHDLGNVTNQWEEMRLRPGENTVRLSADTDQDISGELVYREVYV